MRRAMPVAVAWAIAAWVVGACGSEVEAGAGTREAPGKPRLIVLTDIGGDPDDQQSMIRLMAFANEFEIEGLIASASGTPAELKRAAKGGLGLEWFDPAAGKAVTEGKVQGGAARDLTAPFKGDAVLYIAHAR